MSSIPATTSTPYAKHINIEANTASQMTRRLFIPAAIRFTAELGASLASVGKGGSVQRELLVQVSARLEAMSKLVSKVETEAAKASQIDKVDKQAAAYRDKVFTAVVALRAEVDALEAIMPADLWPVPTYSDLLFKL